MENQVEYWVAVPVYEELYSASNLGRIRRERTAKGWKAGYILKGGLHHKGYVQHTIFSEVGIKAPRKTLKAHNLVALTFLGPKPSLIHQVNHKDGNKLNNEINNLEYLTPKEHSEHSCKAGLKGTKLSKEQVLEIRERGANGEKRSKLSKEFGVSSSSIGYIITRRRWAWLD